jgi:oxygen-independent coproporphyrinogen III oxidase
VDPDKQARQFLLLMQWLREAGYEHYEVSNFAKPGFRSRHNSSYWRGDSYLGIGPSAHSYNGTERRWNVPNNPVYIQTVKEAAPKRETERLTPPQQLNEFIMISLRTMEGLDLNRVERNWGGPERIRIEKGLFKFTRHQLVVVQEDVARLTDEGMLRADGIAADLFS